MKNLNLFVPKFRNDEIIEHIRECLDKGWTGLGFKTIDIETKWKEYTGLPHAHFINSNTSGLHLAIKILKDSNKWSDGDEIITTPMTFVSTNHAINYENLTPVFADVDDYLCLDPKSVERLITKKTKAVIFVGIGGNTGQLNEIIDLCNCVDTLENSEQIQSKVMSIIDEYESTDKDDLLEELSNLMEIVYER
jgi:dTDP-4-amino-4,6-dideoxygalactose transaminase